MRGHTVFGGVFAGVRANEVERERSRSGSVGVAGSVENPLGRLAERLRRLCAERGLSVDALRARSGLGRTTVSQALNGRAVPSPSTVVALAKALRADPEPLLDLLAQGSTAADTSKASAARTSAVCS
ncbi:helix-turn-helix domain-containing protein [Embleya sp. NPDC059237]|uniref:helix-turn-helix domain-containing protein n=1 Tax=Embleya sp. NPDC059237 TaxID=3346784 RepID=UPI003695586C